MAKKRPKAPNHGREECYVETNSGIALVARTFPFFSRSNGLGQSEWSLSVTLAVLSLSHTLYVLSHLSTDAYS